MSDIVKLYRQTVAAKKIGEGRSVVKTKYVAGKSGRVAVLKVLGQTTYLSTGIARGHNLLKDQGSRPNALMREQLGTDLRRSLGLTAGPAKPTSIVLGTYSAAKQREAHYA